MGLFFCYILLIQPVLEMITDTTSYPDCKECGVKLDKKKLKGNLCMKCPAVYMSRYRLEKRQKAIELLGDKCKDCGKTYPAPVYDFHHTDEKSECVSILIRNNRKLETILNEASKCELLCSNCHRIRHFK